VISDNGLTGISFYSSGVNVIRGNSISANSLYGLALYLFSSGNTIYHNNFNNTIQAFAESTQTIWNYNGEGNYWKDYTGRDLNNDGIGDSPYIIVIGNEDKHPLMGAFSDFDVTLERKTYHVTVVSNSTISDFGFRIGTETGNRIISFRAATRNGKMGFSRVTVPRELMEDPYTVLIGAMRITPSLLNVSDPAEVCLYFTFSDGDAAISVIASETLHLYSELLAKYLGLQGSLQTLNQTYYGLLTNYLKLQSDLFNLSKALNDSSVQYLGLQGSLQTLNQTYYGLLTDYSRLLGNYTSLLQDFDAMGISYQQHLYDDSEQTQNIRSLIYIFAATTAIFMMTTLYLSKLQSAGMRRRTNGHVNSET
jgi:parallel beta-helix repeat protein